MAKTTSRALRGIVLDKSNDTIPPLFMSPCNQFIAVAVGGADPILSRGAAAQLGLELLHAALDGGIATDAVTLFELQERLDLLRERVRTLALRLCMSLNDAKVLQ